MKKQAISLFILTILLFLFSACSSDAVNEKPSSPEHSSPVFSPGGSNVASTADPSAITKASEQERPVTSRQTTEAPMFNTLTLDAQEIYNQGNVIVSVTGIEFDGWMGPEISVLIENNSDKNITVQTRNSSINGYMIDFQMSTDVVAGKKAYGNIIIMSSDLEAADIESIADIEFSLHIFDSDTWNGIADSDQICLSTNIASTYVQSYDDSGFVLYDDSGLRIIAKGLVSDEYMGTDLVLYIENNTDRNITIQASNTSVNGFMIDPVMSDDIMSGKKIIGSMTFMEYLLEENKITKFEEIETVFHIFDSNTWDTIVDTPPITITLN